ncbi:NAD(P)H-hydrate dehydratase [bacterium]|nr:NAD(P)H-hydrate dehydratase [bacterium]
MRLVTGRQMREIDSYAIGNIGIPSLVLMENAGLKILFTLEKVLGGLKGKRFAIVCGKGNNGGDGLVVARHLFNNHIPIHVFICANSDELSTDTSVNLKILQNSGFQPIHMAGKPDLDRLKVALEFSDCLIDALYGTGFSGAIDGFPKDVVRVMNEANVRRVSIDVPSGLCSTTGKLSNPSFRADVTITLGLPKLGLYLYPGCESAGQIWIADLGIPQAAYDAIPSTQAILTRELAQVLLPVRPDNSHKGTFGSTLILAGSRDYHGAGILVTYGALRSGVGLVNLGLPDVLAGKMFCETLPDVVVRTFNSADGGFFISEDSVQEFYEIYDSIIIGPGWGRGGRRFDSIKSILNRWKGGLLIDADALNEIEDPEILKGFPGDLILTPHLGEFSRMVKKPIKEIREDLLDSARDFVKKVPCVLVLKSSTPVIVGTDGNAFLCSRPNSGLAKGGSGDLLAGLIGGFLAQGLSGIRAACLGVYLHSDAASLARSELSADAMTVSEIASMIPKAFKSLRGENPEEAAS